MFENRDIVEYILEKSDAVIISEQLQTKLKDEQQRRLDFYELIDEDTKAEFINGEIVYHSPVYKEHTDATRLLLELLDYFIRIARKGYVGFEKTMTKFTRNDYEPDVCYFKEEKSKNFKKGQLIFPVPDLAVEILSKSWEAIHRDRKTKYKDYEKHGVSEYWIIDADEETVEQYVLEEGEYRLVLKSGEGNIRSHAVEGFEIPIRSIFDEEVNLETVRKILK